MDITEKIKHIIYDFLKYWEAEQVSVINKSGNIIGRWPSNAFDRINNFDFNDYRKIKNCMCRSFKKNSSEDIFPVVIFSGRTLLFQMCEQYCIQIFLKKEGSEARNEKTVREIVSFIEDTINVRNFAPGDFLLNSVMNFLRTRTCDELAFLRTSEIAAETGVSLSYLCDYCKRGFNLKPKQLLNREKMSRAAISLREDRNIKIHKLASISGFHDIKYFSRVFKKHFGMTPTEFRAKGDCYSMKKIL